MPLNGLELEEFRRYGRQMVLPEIGIKGQLRLKHSSILVIGAGGLGCPAIAYLVGAGIGLLGVVDSDTIDLSNVHRQTIHKPKEAGMNKVDSIQNFASELNSNVKVRTYLQRITYENAVDMIKDYDLVLDCCDNQPTRYLVSDTCVVLRKPLISGSALKSDGQLAVFNYGNGPCYRCLFPVPSPTQVVQSCGEAGVLGPVVGIIGIMQALEAIKMIVKDLDLASSEASPSSSDKQCRLSLFSAFGDPQWRSIGLRRRMKQCIACGEGSELNAASITQGRIDYEHFCANTMAVADVPMEDPQLDAHIFSTTRENYTVLDVRDRTHFEIAHLSGSTSVPMETLEDFIIDDCQQPIMVVCRTGTDSRIAARQLRTKYPRLDIMDLRGGLQAYSKVDRCFPLY